MICIHPQSQHSVLTLWLLYCSLQFIRACTTVIILHSCLPIYPIVQQTLFNILHFGLLNAKMDWSARLESYIYCGMQVCWMSCKLRYGIPIVVHIICKAGHLAAHIHAGNQLHSEKAVVFSNSYKIPYEYLDCQTKPGLGDLEKRQTWWLSQSQCSSVSRH